MLKRVLSGIVYVAVIVGFFFLRGLVDSRLFGILIYAFSLIGTYEMVHAFSAKRVLENGKDEVPDQSFDLLPNKDAQLPATDMALSLSQKIAVYVYALLFTPAYYIVEWLWAGHGYRGMLIATFVLGLVLLCLLVVDHKNTDLKNTGAAMFCGFYPTAILSTMILANAFKEASALALLLIFVISPVADTFAFLIGSMIGGKKLCPSISPKKTIAGAVGGVVFGTGASVLLYWLYTVCSGYVYAGVGSAWAGTPWVFFAVLGLVTSLLTEFGDLVESVIKRRLGVKDMGRLLPGHGGVLDRIDGTLFASMIVYILFALFITPVATVVP